MKTVKELLIPLLTHKLVPDWVGLGLPNHNLEGLARFMNRLISLVAVKGMSLIFHGVNIQDD